ncbi:LOW QUALITY PROTEIN: hypothetical protein OSB04_031198 [Centaurea solstitialis]|uniref:ATP-dependent DNA helicase n=1 Tax=Centaurea solstitialis TaxID=347529 RepID=A0AA38SLQ3_9ASTR|nr:LOW QUALITY PROTEIN: hypothetical protein OSB04_031198 [Centaurea solstitialis]
MDTMGHSFAPYETVFCDYCGGNHFSSLCHSNPYFVGDSNWDTSHLNGHTQSWEDHPNLSLNGQDHDTFTSLTPSYQDWSNTYPNTFDQSWEEQVDFSENFQKNESIPSYQEWSNTFSNNFEQSWEEREDFSGKFQGDDFNNSFLPPAPSFEQVDFSGSFQGDVFNNSFLPPTPSAEQVEVSESLEDLMNDFLENLKRSVDNMTTSVEEIISEREIQSQTPIPCEIDKFECVGMDKGEAIILESSKEMESFEKTPEHLSNPSSLQINEEVQQSVKIVTHPIFESMQNELIVVDIAKSLQQSCVENLKTIFKRGCDNHSKDSKSFRKSIFTVGEVMWKTLSGMKCSLIFVIKVLYRYQKAKEVNRKVYKHKWKEKHQEPEVERKCQLAEGWGCNRDRRQTTYSLGVGQLRKGCCSIPTALIWCAEICECEKQLQNKSLTTYKRSFVVYERFDYSKKIEHYYDCYDPLAYPLFFPNGESGWHAKLPRHGVCIDEIINEDENFDEDLEGTNIITYIFYFIHLFFNLYHLKSFIPYYTNGSSGKGRKTVLMRDYYCYKFQIRSIKNVILLGERLFQQFIEAKIRSDLYQGVVDCVNADEVQPNRIGQRVVFPASFIEGPCDMRRRYMYAMALVHVIYETKILDNGLCFLQVFLTMMCNPNWPEILQELLPSQTPQDRSNLVARVFRAKLEDLKDQLFRKHILGEVGTYVYVIEFQKRGLPHAHFLMIMKSEYKITNADNYEKIVCAEILKSQTRQIGDKARDAWSLWSFATIQPLYGSIISVKYLFKYVYKGHDTQVIHVDPNKEEVHLPNKQLVRFRDNDILTHIRDKRSMLTAFFEQNKTDLGARRYLYKDFSNQYTWNAGSYRWNPRRQGSMRGRLVSANPVEGERYYLRLLLSRISGPTCFEDLYTVNGVLHPTFRKAALERGLIETDNNFLHYLAEASVFQFPGALRRLFSTILIYCEPGDVRKLWYEHYDSLSEDYRRHHGNVEGVQDMVLTGIVVFLQSMGKNLDDFDLPSLNAVQEEYSIIVESEDLCARNSLHPNQMHAFDEIMRHVDNDWSGGTGKTFLYKSLLADVRSRGFIALVTASSGVVANNMPRGRTAHSRFKIPLSLSNNSMCNIKKQSGTAQLLQATKIIIWDEASMAKRQAVEAFDRTMQDITSVRLPIDGKIVIMEGDFRQVLPVTRHGTRAQIVDSSLRMSPIWSSIKKL